jgi:hypothetical protein
VVVVHKAACDCANAVQLRATGSIGVIFTEVDVEVRRLRADLQSTKEDLQLTHTELASVEAEANRFSLALTGVVISRAFFLFFPCNHSVNINIIIFFFRRSKRQRNFSLFYFAS